MAECPGPPLLALGVGPFNGPVHKLCGVRKTELLLDVGPVGFDGAQAQVEASAELTKPVRTAAGQWMPAQI